MEIVLDISNNNGMAGIISSLAINSSFCGMKVLVPDIWLQYLHLGKAHQRVFPFLRLPTALRL